MKIIEAEQAEAVLSYPAFVDQLQQAFASDYQMPPRQVMSLAPGESHDAFAMLPTWNDEVITLKTFTYFPENQDPYSYLYSKILVYDRQRGVPLAMVDGIPVTCWRTAGVSALASRYLSRPESRELLILGTGNLCAYLAKAHASVRSLEKIRIWGRSMDKAEAVVNALEIPGVTIERAEDREEACRRADIIVAATGSHEPLVEGAWLKPGAHVDCLGNHHTDKRECDTEVITRARVFVDTKANCFKEAGEILVPVEEGVFSLDDVAGELSDLCRGKVEGRISEDQITFFKSVGCAIGDMAGATAVLRRVSNS